MITGRSVATLVIFIISIIFVIRPVSFHVQLPYLGRRRVGLGLATAPIIAIAILWAAQCLGPAQIRNGIAGVDGVKPYNILILFFSLAYMAITLDITGILQSAAFWVSNKGGSNGYKLYLYFYLMLTVLSIFLGNDPIILSGTAFLVYYTKVAELDPVSWLMSEFAAANTASMVLFVGNPTNVVICEGFRQKVYSEEPSHHGDLDVRSVLLDPKGALVGSILLASCLIVIIIVSFFHVDVWMITLPFAVAKFIFDISWDHYRYIKGIPMLGMANPKRKRSVDSGTDTIPVPDIPSDQTTIRQLSKHFSHANDTHTPTRLSTMGTSLTMIDESAHGASDTMVLPTRTESPTLAEHVPIQAPGLTHRTSTPNELPPPGTSNDPRDDKKKSKLYSLSHHFPTFFTALPRLPFKLVPFAFSQFILIEALTHQGWIELFSDWLVRATNRQMHPVIWLIGVLGVVLCNISGTNIGATILLTKVIRAAQLPPASDRAGAIALAVASNIGAVSFTFSASLAGLLWQTILKQKGIKITQTTFAKWNALPLLMMTCVGLAVVSAEMAVIT
ncbi:hypothetical protein EYR38_001602 [Pleurotus pulmonarius]|nr:hypothetical protein EYR38_001602 [Pleurotus pulmonarius]